LRARSAKRLAFLVDQLVQNFGGITGVARQWHDCHHHALEKGKDHLVLRSFRTLFRLWTAAQELAPRYDDMSDDELAEVVKGEALNLIQERPEIVLLVAETMGCTVAWPPGTDPAESLPKEV
jgi:hypothetical protein